MKDKNIITFGKKFTTIIFLILFLPLSMLANEKIVFGLTGTVFKGDLEIFDKWKNYLEKRLETPVELRFSRTYAEMRSMINLGQVDIAYVCNTTFVELKKQNSAKLLSIPVSNGVEVYYSYIISKKETPYKSLQDFKGKLFAFTDPDSNSGAIAPTYTLLKKGNHPKKFFKHLVYTYEHEESIKAVLDDFVDGASVDSLVYKQYVKRFPKKSESLRIVEKLGPYTMSPLVANSELKNKTFKSIQDIFLQMHKEKEGKEILHALSLDKLNFPNDKEYDDIEEIVDFIEKHK